LLKGRSKFHLLRPNYSLPKQHIPGHDPACQSQPLPDLYP
jgi:hypothetical protein